MLGLLAVSARLLPDHPVDLWHQWVESILQRVRGVPLVVFVLATAIAPLIGVPVVPLYLMAGVVYSPVHGLPVTLVAILVALTLNLILSHRIALYLRPLVENVLRKFGSKIPLIEGLPMWKVILLVRLTPGAPLMIQNYVLSLAGIPLGLYILVSLPIEMMICCGYMIAGKSFATGHLGWLIGGVGIVGFSVLATGLIRDRIRAGKSAAEPNSAK